MAARATQTVLAMGAMTKRTVVEDARRKNEQMQRVGEMQQVTMLERGLLKMQSEEG